MEIPKNSLENIQQRGEFLKNGCLSFLIGTVVVGLVLATISYLFSYTFDTWQNPWAYSTSKPLLVGKWQGSFKDPNNIEKTIDLEIFVPTSSEKRWNRAFSTRKRRSQNSRFFEGLVNVNSKLGKENYELWGSVKKEGWFVSSGHEFSLNTRPVDDKKMPLPNFQLGAINNATWQGGDELSFDLKFNYHKADGSSFWSSSEEKYTKQLKVVLHRNN